jgi:UDP-N-acetylmuramyl pentapeptide phosphotransferase/UDP-N-acetylglucosamine-1-phosphate transferase
MNRKLALLLVLTTLGMIGWYAYWAIAQTRTTPGSGRFVLLFFGGLALADDRAKCNPAGRVVLQKLKIPWHDGTAHLVMTPLD